MNSPYVFQRGETIRLFLEAVDADADALAVVTGVTATLKRAVNGTVPTDPDAPVVATFDVEARTPENGEPGGWLLKIEEEVSETLAPGTYVTNARLAIGGDVEKTEPLFLRIEAAT